MKEHTSLFAMIAISASLVACDPVNEVAMRDAHIADQRARETSRANQCVQTEVKQASEWRRSHYVTNSCDFDIRVVWCVIDSPQSQQLCGSNPTGRYFYRMVNMRAGETTPLLDADPDDRIRVKACREHGYGVRHDSVDFDESTNRTTCKEVRHTFSG